jgi:dTDP-4-dehydrorhamnose 3,5-epimerase
MGETNLINGVLVTPQKIIRNLKGDVLHAMKKSDVSFNGYGEAYFSTVLPGNIKAWKKHFNMTLNLVVPIGKVRVVIYDDRDNSSTKGMFMDVIISPENYNRLTIPPDLWFGFEGKGLDINLLLNIANIEHNPDEQINIDKNQIKFNW